MMSDHQYIFISRDPNSSVYRALGQYLLHTRQGEWRKAKPDSLRFHLMLGDRNKLPYARLGQAPGFQQLVNYYRGSETICRKCSFVREMQRHCKNKNIKQFPWFPESYIIIPKQNHIRKLSAVSDIEIKTAEPDVKISPAASNKLVCTFSNTVTDSTENNAQNIDDRAELLEYCTTYTGSHIWIAKSSSGAKGEGIKITDNVQDLLDYIDHQQHSYIIQKYIPNPFLLPHHRKFDIRCWVLLDSNHEVYLYNQGVLRTASERYDITDFTNITSHLTNHNLQLEKSENFGVYEEGNEMFYDEFNKYLMETRGETMETRIIPQIKDIIKSSFDIIIENLDTTGLDYKSFQLFGFDFLLDDTLKVWLLEINGAPACAQKLLPDLIKNLVETAIDPVYTPSYTDTTSSLFHFDKLQS